MQVLQFLTLLIVTFEYVHHEIYEMSEVDHWKPHIFMESLLLLLYVLQNLVFFKFMFKFNKVEIELKAFYEQITLEQVMAKLYKLKVRVRVTFGIFFLACLFYVISYLICEVVEMNLEDT